VTTDICSRACIVTQNNVIACNKFSLKARESHFDVQLPSKYNKSVVNQTARNFFCINRPFALVDHVINFRETRKQFENILLAGAERAYQK